MLADKTGVLIATAARYGAMFAGCDAQTVEIMREYGERLGHGLPARRRPHRRLLRRRRTSARHPGRTCARASAPCPVLYALASTDPADARLRELLQTELRDQALLDEALELLRAHPAMEQAREHTSAVATQAQDALDPLPDSEAKTALRALATSVVTRVG